MRGLHALATLCALVATAACEPQPKQVECVCRCEPDGAATGSTTTVAPRPAQSATGATTQPATDTAPRKARGPVGMEPGSGDVVEMPPEDRTQMKDTLVAFMEDAKERDLETMTAHTTERLGASLERAVPRYEERLYRGLRPSIDALGSGVELIEVRDMGRGNHEGHFRFGDGHERRVIFFEESGRWLLNRL
ncbi:MAG: hypothetical protein ACQEXJ_24035 [Myxococcota bacterium]